MAKTARESDLQYVAAYDGPETCCKIVGRDKYGGKVSCGIRATVLYKTPSGGKVYLCDRCKPKLWSAIESLFGGFENVMKRAFGK